MTSFVSGVEYEKVGLLVGVIGVCGGLRSVLDKLQKIDKGVYQVRDYGGIFPRNAHAYGYGKGDF